MRLSFWAVSSPIGARHRPVGGALLFCSVRNVPVSPLHTQLSFFVRIWNGPKAQRKPISRLEKRTKSAPPERPLGVAILQGVFLYQIFFQLFLLLDFFYKLGNNFFYRKCAEIAGVAAFECGGEFGVVACACGDFFVADDESVRNFL